MEVTITANVYGSSYHLQPLEDLLKLNKNTLTVAISLACLLLFIVYCFVCHKLYKAKEKKIFKLSWRGSPREATGLIRNGLPQLNN